LHVRSKASRIYFDGKTKELRDAFIFDVGYLQNKEAMNSNFSSNFQKELTKKNQKLEQW